jgi:hypothetical protein
MERTIDIIIESMSDEEWEKISLKASANRAHRAAERYRDRRDSVIKFGDWILDHSVYPDYNNKNEPRWSTRFGNEYTYYTTEELFNIYIRGDWDIEEDDDTNDDLV